MTGSPMNRADLDAIIRLVDLTSLGTDDTPALIKALCWDARQPDPDDATVPAVAAVCVYPALLPAAVNALQGTGIRVAAVAGAFPSGVADPDTKAVEAAEAVAAGAREIDLTIDRRPVLAGHPAHAEVEVATVRAAIGDVPLKVILETGQLEHPGLIATTAHHVIAGGADMLKTSTGKANNGKTWPGATPEVAAILLAAATEHTDRPIGVKVSGGVRTVDAALEYLALARKAYGSNDLTPTQFRFGASALLAELVRTRRTLTD
jgi:deoxyribose-phosphate aldolase